MPFSFSLRGPPISFSLRGPSGSSASLESPSTSTQSSTASLAPPLGDSSSELVHHSKGSSKSLRRAVPYADAADFSKDDRRKVMSNDEFKGMRWFKIYMLLFAWFPAIVITIYYTNEIVIQYSAAVASPTSTTLSQLQDSLALPQVTICNWNQNGNTTDDDPLTECLECEITLENCLYNTTADCRNLWSEIKYNTPAGVFSCYQFNPFVETAIYTSTVGYSGAYATIFSVALLPKTDPPTNRAGAQVTFTSPGGATPYTIYDEVNFASVGYDTFYSMQYISTIQSQIDPTEDGYNITSFQTPSSTVSLLPLGLKKIGNDTIGYIGVSFSYQTLNQEIVLFGIQYTLTSLFGDLSSIINTVMGLSAVKVVVGACIGYICWKHKDIDLLGEHFNG